MIIQSPSAVSFSRNLKNFIISSDVPVSVVLRNSTAELVSQQYIPGADGKITIELSQIVHDSLSFRVPEGEAVLEQNRLQDLFTLTVSSVNGKTVQHSFRAIRGGANPLYDEDELFIRGNFLTWQPTEKNITSYTPEYLTYFALAPCSMVCSVLFQGGGITQITLAKMEAAHAYTVDVSFAQIMQLSNAAHDRSTIVSYDVFVIDADAKALTYRQRFLLRDSLSPSESIFGFVNSLGGYDTLRTFSSRLEVDTEHQIAGSESALEFRVDEQRKYTETTGFLSLCEEQWVQDFLLSTQKMRFNCPGTRGVVVLEDKISGASRLSSSASFSFVWMYADEKPGLRNVSRRPSPRVMNVVPDGSTRPEPLPDMLSLIPRMPLQGSVMIPVQAATSPYWNSMSLSSLAAYLTSQSAKFQGLFESLEKLQKHCPTPTTGEWALVGLSVPAAVYIERDGIWTPTGQQSGGSTVITMPNWCRDIDLSAIDTLNDPGTSPGIWNVIVKKGSRFVTVGVMLIISDTQAHGVHQLFYTREVLNNGVLDGSVHTDNHTYLYERAFHTVRAPDYAGAKEVWTPWEQPFKHAPADFFINEYNVSALSDGQKFQGINEAVTTLAQLIPKSAQHIGLKCVYVSLESGLPESWQYVGGPFLEKSSWICLENHTDINLSDFEQKIKELITADVKQEELILKKYAWNQENQGK